MKKRGGGAAHRSSVQLPHANSMPQTMSSLLVDAFIGDQTPRKPPENPSSVTMISNILKFLDASPMTLFEGPPSEPSDRDCFYQENLEAIISCVLAPNETVRKLAAAVATRLLTNEPVLSMLRTSKAFGSQSLKPTFWRLRCVFIVVQPRYILLTERSSLVLSSMCDRISPSGNDSGLKSIHCYLESRLLLLKSIPVHPPNTHLASSANVHDRNYPSSPRR